MVCRALGLRGFELRVLGASVGFRDLGLGAGLGSGTWEGLGLRSVKTWTPRHGEQSPF